MTTTIDTNAAASLTITDANTADTITVSDGPTESGFKTTQVATATDTTIFANQSNVIIDGGDKGDAVVLDNPVAAAGLQSLTIQNLGTGSTIDGGNANANSPDITVGTLTMTAAGSIGVSRALRTQVGTLTVNAGTGGAGNIDIANNVGTTGTLFLADVFAEGGSVFLTNNGTVSESATVVATDSVSITANGSGADLNAGTAGSIDAVNGSTTLQAGGDINLGDGISLNVVLAGAGILMSAGGNITIDASSAVENEISGNVSITAGGDITMLTAPGSITNAPLIVNEAAGGTIALQTGAGETLTVESTDTTAIRSNDGAITLFADAMFINEGINSGTARTTLAPSSAGQTINIGGLNETGVLGITAAELDDITAGVVQLGSDGAGAITLSAPITGLTAGTNVLTLVSNGSVTEGPFGWMSSVPDLRISATGPVTLTNPNNSFQVVAVDATNGVSIVNGTNNLTIGFVDGLGGIGTNNAPINLTADSLVLDDGLNAGSGIVTLASFSPTVVVELGASNGAGILGITDGELGLIEAGVLRVNTGVNAGLGIEGAVSRHAGYNTLSLSGAVIVQSASLAVANLALSGLEGIALTSAGNSVDTLAFTNLLATVSFTDGSSNGLTIGTVDGLTSSWNAGGATTIQSAGDLTLATGISSTGAATLTSTSGEIIDGDNGIDIDVTAPSLALSATTGIGTASDPLQTRIGALGASTSTGGIFINNNRAVPGTLSFSDGNFTVTGASGDIVLTNNGTIDSLTSSDIISGPGNITIKALGANADINLGSQTGAFSIAGGSGLVDVEAGRDLNLGNSAGFGAIESSEGSIKLVAGRNLTMDANSEVVVANATGTITARAGGNFSMTTSPGSLNDDFFTAGGAISLSAGAGSTMTLASLSTDAVISGGGNITLTADNLSIAAAVIAGAGDVLIRPVTVGQLISLGTATGGLTLSGATLGEVTATTLTIGSTTAGSVAVAGTVNPANVTNLTIKTGGGFGESTGSVIGIGAGVLTIDFDGNGAGATADFSNLTIAAGTVDLVGGTGNDIFEFSAASLAASEMISGGTGSDELLMTTAGTVNAGGVSGVETYVLANGGANTLSLTNANFAGVTSSKITVDGGSGGNTVNASAVTGTRQVILIGGAGKDVFTGGVGKDVFEFSAANLASTDTLAGGGGSDELLMTTAGTIHSGSGVTGVETFALANGGANTLTLTNGNFTGVTGDTITVDGGSGGNTISAAGLTGSNQAILIGGAGADVLTAGQHETMTGGAGADIFAFTTPGTLALPDTNTITDFTHSTDKITFSDAGFNLGLAGSSSTPTALPSTLFTSNSTGSFTSTAQRFAYNTTTGALNYDAHGDKAGSSVQLVATLNGHPTLTGSDLFFVS